MKTRKEGFISILFNEQQSTTPREDLERVNRQKKQLEKLVENGIFFPRNRLNLKRLQRVNEVVSVSQYEARVNRSEFKKMYIDGSSIDDISTCRPVQTQSIQRRSLKDRMVTPDGSRTSRSIDQDYDFPQIKMFEDRLRMSMHGQQVFINSKGGLTDMEQMVLNRSMNLAKQDDKDFEDFKELDEETESSSVNTTRRRRFAIKIKKAACKPHEESEAKATLSLRKQLVKAYPPTYVAPQGISSKAYIVYELEKNSYDKASSKQMSKGLKAVANSKISVEIASLTKIMTCALTLEVCHKFGVNIKKHQYQIGSFEVNIEGTSAELKIGQVYTIEQLLYGLMLPSGNDASLALACFCGKLLDSQRDKERISSGSKKNYYQRFICEMNKKSMEIDMKRTVFANSHGLSNNLNKSCASDVVLMASYALHNAKFRQIVACKQYSATVTQKISAGNHKDKAIKWQNTHRLLHTHPQYYRGIKTGITETAGPCLASLVVSDKREFIIVVLNSKTLKARFRDTEKLRQWLWKKERLGQQGDQH